jgi:hypothetical protein
MINLINLAKSCIQKKNSKVIHYHDDNIYVNNKSLRILKKFNGHITGKISKNTFYNNFELDEYYVEIDNDNIVICEYKSKKPLYRGKWIFMNKKYGLYELNQKMISKDNWKDINDIVSQVKSYKFEILQIN